MVLYPHPVKAFRWSRALRWVVRAEAAEALAQHAADEDTRDKYGKDAIEYYLRAMKWWPIERVTQLPPPSNVGSHPADERLYGAAGETVPCVVCGSPIRHPRASEDTTGGDVGLYCERCANF